MIKLMIVDDHIMFREGLRQQFKLCPDIQIVAEAGTIEQATELLKKMRPDILILDIKLPDGNGTNQIPIIKKAHPRCRIIMLSMFNNIRYVTHALEQGAIGFVLKGAPFQELLAAVHNASNGKTFVSEEIGWQLADRLNHDSRNGDIMDILSKREFEVMNGLVRGLSIKELAAQMAISEKTVSTYKARLMQKLSLTNHTELVRIALEAGLAD